MATTTRRFRRPSTPAFLLVIVLVTLLLNGGNGQKAKSGGGGGLSTSGSGGSASAAVPIGGNNGNSNGGGGGTGINGNNANNGDTDLCHGEKWCAFLDETEALALDAIRSLHRQLDDDKNGNIDLTESNEFLREELKYEKNIENRQQAFHREDNQVSVQELWESWIKSEVHNWTVKQTVEWLITFVGLPQHQETFTDKSINGTVLPILAVNHNNFLQTQLGIKESITRQRIAVKAMDVVLFGPPRDTSNRVKEVILSTLLTVAIITCYLVFKRYQFAQEDLNKMAKHMAELSKAEETLADLQHELERARIQEKEKEPVASAESSKIRGDDPEEISKLRDENMVLRSELHRAEVELQDKCWVPPPALQHWMQYTYELELKTYNKKKNGAEKQLKQAKDACDKLKKKRSSLMGAFVTTHGRSIDDVDKAILEARTSLTEITHELQERMHRWKQIEFLIGCSIMNNPGIQHLENLLKVYGKPQYASGPGSVMSNSQDDIDDDASSIYCPSAVHKLVGSSTYLMFPAGGHQNYSYCCTSPSCSAGHYFTFPSHIHPHAYLQQQYSPHNDPSSSPRTDNLCSDCMAASSPPPSNSELPFIFEEDSVSGPTSSSQHHHLHSSSSTSTMQSLSMARSKSASSMLNLRDRGLSRESSSKDSSNGEDDGSIVLGDAADITNARRVTFRADHRSRMKAYTSARTNGSTLFDSMDNEEARRVVSKALSQSHSMDSIASSSSKTTTPEESVPSTQQEDNNKTEELDDQAATPPEMKEDTVPETELSLEQDALQSHTRYANHTEKDNTIPTTLIYNQTTTTNNKKNVYQQDNSNGVPVAATFLQYSNGHHNNHHSKPSKSGSLRGTKIWSTLSRLVHPTSTSSPTAEEKQNNYHDNKTNNTTTTTTPTTANGAGNNHLHTSSISLLTTSSTKVKRSSSKRISGMFASLRKRHSGVESEGTNGVAGGGGPTKNGSDKKGPLTT